ncbi:MAG: hypothetical protein E7164_01930 [Firmicutes bacterium]|nr:hypothetical protein [Bacillota bacterium]
MNEKYKRFLKYGIIALLMAIFLEIFVFNINHFVSLMYPKSEKLDFIKSYGESNYYSHANLTLYRTTYEVSNINKKINNIFLNINPKENAEIELFLTDEANKLLFSAGSHQVSSIVEKSNFIKINTSGKSTDLKLEVVTQKSDFNIQEIYINKTVPIYFNFLRFFLCMVIIISAICFKKYNLFSHQFDEYKYKFILIFTFFFLFIGIYIFVYASPRANVNLSSNEYSEHNQYVFLAQSLKQGKFSIDLPVTDKLLALENPYDFYYRGKHLKMNEDFYLDYAFYNGKYYSYFGVVPCLLLYLPFNLITGNSLYNSFALLISCVFYVIAAFYLVYQLFKKYFPNASFKWYYLFSLLLSFASGMSYFLRLGHFYNIPIVMGAAFTMLGLGLWIKSSLIKDINKKYLLLGAVCMALVAGCRPQMLLASFLIFPIFWNQIKSKEIFKIKNIICLAIPYVIVAGFLMYYNYARFGSVFDFGANYNLTSNDMTKRGFVFDRIFLGIYSFLFEFPKINVIFPFINYYHVSTLYHGITISETLAGGFFALNILGIINLFIFKLKKLFKDNSLYYLSLFSIIFSLIIVIADTQMAGLVPRYIGDFGYLLTLSTIIIAMTILTNYKGNTKLISKIFIYLILFSLLYNFLVYFTSELVIEEYTYKNIFYYFYYLFMFWL